MRRVPVYAVWLVAGLLTALTIRQGSFTAWGTDPASYITAAHQWAARDLYIPDAFQSWAPPLAIGVPLGSRPSAVPGTYVTMYPLGFPVFLAVGALIDPELGPYVVAPIFAGILVLSAFAVARRISGDWGALLAACLVALNPIVMCFTATPMSDVPATALVMVALAMSTRPSLMAAAAAGASVAAATMMRPVLAPLGVVPLFLLLRDAGGWRWRHATLYVAAASIGPAMLGWSQAALYGSVLTPGYYRFDEYFDRARIAVNASLYIRHLVEVSSPVVFLGFLCAVPLYYARRDRDPMTLSIIAGLMAIAAINIAVFLPYVSYEDVSFTRFLLPAHTVLLVLLAAATTDICSLVARAYRPLVPVCLLPIAIVVFESSKRFDLLTYGRDAQPHARMMGLYLHDVLPGNAVIVSYLHSAALAHYTGRQIARFDVMPRAHEAEGLITRLIARGYRPVFVLDQENERMEYKLKTLGTNYERLDWPPRANAAIPGSSTLWYIDTADRKAHPPLDLLR